MRRLLQFADRSDLGLLFVIGLPVLTVTAALAGALLGAVVPAMVIAVLIGIAGAWLVSSVFAARIRALALRIHEAAGHRPDPRGIFEGRREWRELADAIDDVVDSLDAQAGQLADERVRSTRLLEELPSAVLLFGGEDIVYANEAARVMFGGSAQAPGTPPVEIFVDPTCKALLDAVEETTEVGRAIDVEIERGGAILAARASTVGSGEAVLVIRDVTGARRLAAVRRDFVINASHELKTPVAGIQALAESLALALRHDPPRAARMVARIEQEAGRLARLVRDLLDLARLEEPDAPDERRRVDLVDVVHAQIERLHSAALDQNITIATDLPERSVVVAVPEDVRSIVANLLENAVRYNRPGGTVAVRLSGVAGRVELEVADTGEGIPPHERDRIFERFYRIDKARSRAAGGTGLGLSLARHASERLGGTITLDSELGVGSTFRVVLPVARD